MTKTGALVVVAAALALGACKHEGDATGVGTSGPDKSRTTSPAIGELLAGVPSSAAAIGFMDLSEAPWALLMKGWPMPLDEASQKSLDKELREYLGRVTGLDVSKLQYAVGYASGPPPHVAVLVKAVGGTLTMPGGSEHEGGKLWTVDPAEHISLAIRGDVLVLGDDGAVRETLETLAGKRKPVTTDNKALVDWLRKDSSGAVFALAAIKPKDLPLPPPVTGLERVSVTIRSRGIAAAIDGDDATIGFLQAAADQAFAKMLAEIEHAHADALAGKTNPAEGVAAIIAAAYGKSMAAKLKPQRTGNRLSAALDLGTTDVGGGTMAVAWIGILAAVAIPAFMDYMKRSKKSEAALQLNKIGKNAKRAYAETGKFPVGATPLMPAESCCGQPNNHCRAVPAQYAANAVWKELDFQIDEPTLYQYSYRGSPDGQSFVAKAIGDLDCDGIPITYELAGSVANGNPVIILTEPPPNSD